MDYTRNVDHFEQTATDSKMSNITVLGRAFARWVETLDMEAYIVPRT